MAAGAGRETWAPCPGPAARPSWPGERPAAGVAAGVGARYGPLSPRRGGRSSGVAAAEVAVNGDPCRRLGALRTSSGLLHLLRGDIKGEGVTNVKNVPFIQTDEKISTKQFVGNLTFQVDFKRLLLII